MLRPRFGSLCFVCAAFGTAVILWGPVQAQEGHNAVQNLEETGPLWAYGFSKPPEPGETHVPQGLERNAGLRGGETMEEATKLWSLPGSDKQLSRMDFRGDDLPSWFPGDHPPMPRMISHGSEGLGNTARACGGCHLVNGKGRPENAPPAGQPVAYTLQQLDDFANGLRYTSDPRKRNTPTMIRLAKGMTAEEKLEVAEYFAAIPWTPWIRVIETDLVPEMHLEEGNMFITVGTERTVPIAGRIIETPENELESNYLRSPRSGWNAYVPVGSLAMGENLVTTGGISVVDGKIAPGKTVACATCHGPDLMGLADIPGIAGRSPSYMMRQLWDMKQGTRNGAAAQLMKPVIANLTVEDMTGIVAYLAALMPLPGPVAAPTPAP